MRQQNSERGGANLDKFIQNSIHVRERWLGAPMARWPLFLLSHRRWMWVVANNNKKKHRKQVLLTTTTVGNMAKWKTEWTRRRLFPSYYHPVQDPNIVILRRGTEERKEGEKLRVLYHTHIHNKRCRRKIRIERLMKNKRKNMKHERLCIECVWTK